MTFFSFFFKTNTFLHTLSLYLQDMYVRGGNKQLIYTCLLKGLQYSNTEFLTINKIGKMVERLLRYFIKSVNFSLDAHIVRFTDLTISMVFVTIMCNNIFVTSLSNNLAVQAIYLDVFLNVIPELLERHSQNPR